MLNIVDEFTRLCHRALVSHSLSGHDVVRCLTQIAMKYGFPRRLRMDNGPEFRSRAVIEWALRHNVVLDYITPGKPTQNAFIESFNGQLREECLDQNVFLDCEDAQRKIDAWREFYNAIRPHSALGGMPPSLFAARHEEALVSTGT